MDRRYPQIDVLYMIGILLVIIGHSHPSDWNLFSGTLLEKIIVFIYTFHMPLFFFIAGFLFINSSSLSRNGYRQWIKDKAWRLLTPYVVLSVISAIPKYYLEQKSLSGMGEYLIEAIFIPRKGVWGHFWFIPTLVLIYCVFGLWRKSLIRSNKKFVLTITFILSCVLYFCPLKTEWFGFNDFKQGVIFFVIGMIAFEQKTWLEIQSTKFTRILFIIVLTVISIVLKKYLYANRVLMLVVAVVMIVACWQLALLIGKNKLARWISKHNFTIYIYSWPFQAIVMALSVRANLIVVFCAMFITGFAMPIFMIFVYEHWHRIHNRFFDLLLGRK